MDIEPIILARGLQAQVELAVGRLRVIARNDQQADRCAAESKVNPATVGDVARDGANAAELGALCNRQSLKGDCKAAFAGGPGGPGGPPGGDIPPPPPLPAASTRVIAE